MATEQIVPVKTRPVVVASRDEDLRPAARPRPPQWRRLLAPLASLKLTVALMALSIFIVFAGTFAQTRIDIWEAIRQYFRIDLSEAFNATAPFIHPSELFVWIDLKLFFPASFFPSDPVFPSGLEWLAAIWPAQDAIQRIPNSVGFWFPRGWTIGVVLVANLLAAHSLRFKLQSSGKRLWAGLGVLLAGLAVTWAVVATHGQGAQSQWLSYDVLWGMLQFALFVLAAGGVYLSVTLSEAKRGERPLLIVASLLLAGIGVLGLSIGTPAPESMRILYQLLKGLLAALVLLGGCLLVFRKRAGIVLLHGGVGLLMGYEVLVGTQHVETQMVIPEGTLTNFAHDNRAVELAVVERTRPGQERHVVIDQSLLKPGQTIRDDRLPFDIKVLEWIPNGLPERLEAGEKTVATKGLGKFQKIVAMERSVGTDSNADFPGAYVQLLRREAAGSKGPESARDLGVYMLTCATDPALHLLPFVEKVELAPAAGGAKPRSYDLALRFVRHYKDYTVELVDVQKNDYAGTTNARDWRSVINLTNADGTSVLDHYNIWMNNPLRFGGETFYQQEWRQTSEGEVTTLQVVQNEGWMAPYVACMIVAVGMFFQFGIGLLRFVDRRGRQAVSAEDSLHEGLTSPAAVPPEPAHRPRIAWALPLGMSALVVLSLGSYAARQRKVVKDDFQLSAFADLPVVMGGRSLPLEALAMNKLMQISDLQSFKEKDPDPTDHEDPKSQPASKWLLDMIVRPKAADQYPVFRIENDTIARSLGLEVSESRRYAYADFEAKLPALRERMSEVNKRPKSQWTVEERKQAELLSKVTHYLDIRGWFGDLEPQIRTDFPALFATDQSRVQRATAVLDMVRRLDAFAEDSKEFRVPLVIPLHVGEAEGSITRFGKLQRRWETYPVASGFRTLDKSLEVQPPPAVAKFDAILAAWKQQDAKAFNAAVADYRNLIAAAGTDDLAIANTQVSLSKSAFEGYFHRIGAFNLLSFAYVLVLLLTLGGWGASGFGSAELGKVLQRTALWTALTLLVMHTLAIAARIYISGRPPVTNLYSSAIFIGWAAVLMGIVFEGIFRMGIGNAVAAIAGFATLRIAHALMGDGDTLAVVEAVLDTQFWLATHVVCITLGYAATYVAGLFGMMYVLRGSRVGLVALGVLAIVAGGAAATSDSSAMTIVGAAVALAGLASTALGVMVLRRDQQVFTVDVQKVISRMTYGTLCAATFLSFVGTVLGGLWADDSWGRFWGWDPKENGALIIVLWNALILHARWDGMVRERGMAALAILGNIVTSWSWFGVNELGIGLHSYGFTEGRLFWLMTFCLSQLLIFAVALLPRSAWWTDRRAAAG